VVRALVANSAAAEKVVKELKTNAVLGYCNDYNPFSDPNLTEKYVNSFSLSTKLSNKISVVDYQEQRENQRNIGRGGFFLSSFL
jgi:hypothetical protein